jgi:ornithine cyclodeaminase
MNLLDIKKLKVWGRNSIHVDLYISEIKEKYPTLIIENCNSIEESVKDTDIIITTTYSSEPLIKSGWIKEGTHITAVGACGPNMQELDENILGKSRVFADSREMCSKHGEISHALEKGIIKDDDIIEIGEALDVFERNNSDITVADLVGLGFEDSVIGSHVYMKALQKKIGIKL